MTVITRRFKKLNQRTEERFKVRVEVCNLGRRDEGEDGPCRDGSLVELPRHTVDAERRMSGANDN
jgi:hypothetical protein